MLRFCDCLHHFLAFSAASPSFNFLVMLVHLRVVSRAFFNASFPVPFHLSSRPLTFNWGILACFGFWLVLGKDSFLWFAKIFSLTRFSEVMSHLSKTDCRFFWAFPTICNQSPFNGSSLKSFFVCLGIGMNPNFFVSASAKKVQC